MFNNHIERLDLFPQSSVDRVGVKTSGLDWTLFMTASILLYNRVKDLKITYSHGTFSSNVIDANPNVYAFHWFSKSGNPDELLKPIKGKFKTIEKLPTHEKFISEQLKQPVSIRIMPNENTVCIFTTELTYQVWHCVQFFIPKFFNVFKEKPLTKEEISFLESLTFKTSLNYTSRIRELANKQEFRAYLLKDQLEAFEKKLFEKKVQTARERLGIIEQDMERALAKYKEACEKRIEALALVTGLRTMADKCDEHTELQNYLLNNPHICCVNLNGSKISFIVKTFLAPHHIQEWDTLSRNNKFFEKYMRVGFGFEEIKSILDSIFSENRCLKLRMCAYFTMDYFGSSVESSRHYDFASCDKDLKNYIPNPHLDNHNCFGSNRQAILDQLVNGDAIGAIECAIACAQRVNIHESMSFDPFVNYLFSSNGKCLVAEDGTDYTVKEAISYLKGNNNERT